MDSTRTMEGVIDDIVGDVFDDDIFKGVSVVSKAGLMISGRAFAQKPETFSAMAAVMLSAAESTQENGEGFKYVVAVFDQSKLFISSVSPTMLIAVRTDSDVPEEVVLERFSQFSSRTKDELIWLH